MSKQQDMNLAVNLVALLLVVVASMCRLELIGAISSAEQQETTAAIFKDLNDNDQAPFANSRGKFIVMPSRLGRFLYHNARPAEKQALLSLASSTGSQTAPIIGYKRLDPLTGITIGKRSPILDGKSMEFVNWEPVFNRQFGLHSPRLYDLHWASAEPSLEVSNGNQAE